MAAILDIYREVARILGDARLVATTDDTQLRFVIDESYTPSITYVFRQAPWKFALKAVALAAGAATPIAGYADDYDLPADWLRTHSVYVIGSTTKRYPIDFKQIGAKVYANVIPSMSYVSNALIGTPANFPEQFTKAVCAYIAYECAKRITGAVAVAEQLLEVYRQHLSEAVRLDAVLEDAWLPSQQDGSFQSSLKYVLQAGNWRFALKEALLVAGAGAPFLGFTDDYDKPADYVRTQSIFRRDGIRELPLDVRDHDTRYSAMIAPALRYVSSTYENPTTWPENFLRTVGAHLGLSWGDTGASLTSKEQQDSNRSLWPQYLAQALEQGADTESPWLRPQLDGRFKAAAEITLEQGFWGWAVKVAILADTTGTPHPGFTNNFAKPSDYLKAQALFVMDGERECPVDARELQAQFSADVTSPILRYLSDADIDDSSVWSREFLECVGAWLGLTVLPNGTAEQVPGQNWATLCQIALAKEGRTQSPWLEHQLSGMMKAGAAYILEQGFWGFANKVVSIVDGAGTPHAGFTNDFAIPADHIKTQSIFVQDSERECPIDVRENDGIWSADITPIKVRYLSSDALDDTTKWSAIFMETLEAWLGIGLQAEANREQVWRTRLADGLQRECIEQSGWLRYQLDGRLRNAAEFILEQANWKFALETDARTDQSGVPAPGYTKDFTLPVDYVRMQAIVYRATTTSREYPVDVRHHDGILSSDVSTITIRFVSNTNLADPTTWPVRFQKTVAAYLGLEMLSSGDAVAKEQGSLPVWTAYLQEAALNDAIPDDPWLRFQLDGTFQRVSRQMLEHGFWHWALKTASLTEQPGTPTPDFAYRFTIPTDHIKTQAVYTIAGVREVPVDVRESDGIWSSDVTPLIVRYLSNASLAIPSNLSDRFLSVVSAFLGIDIQPNVNREEVWKLRLAEALQIETIEQSPWLRAQFDGSFRQATQAVLSAGNWRHFMETAALADSVSLSPAPGYSYNFAAPAGWVKTQAFFKRSGVRECPIDFRETNGQFSANYATPVIRYLSDENLDDPAGWPLPFLAASGAWLGIAVGQREDKADPKVEANWRQIVAESLSLEAIQESPWLRFQRDGSFYRVARELLAKGFWRWAMKTVTLASNRGVELLTNPNLTVDTDWTKGAGWTIHSGLAHKAAGSATALTQAVGLAAGLSYEVTYTVVNRTAGTVTAKFTGGVTVSGTARNNDGTYTETLTAVTGNNTLSIGGDAAFVGGIDNASIKQVITTYPASSGHGYAFAKPTDWVRTFHFYNALGNPGIGQWWTDIEFRDEVDGFDGVARFSANYDPITIRYVSSDGEDSAKWSDAFEQAVLTCLLYEEAMQNPGTPVSRIQVLNQSYKDALKRARTNDDLAERPRVNTGPGQLVRARWGNSGFAREQGWYR